MNKHISEMPELGSFFGGAGLENSVGEANITRNFAKRNGDKVGRQHCNGVVVGASNDDMPRGDTGAETLFGVANQDRLFRQFDAAILDRIRSKSASNSLSGDGGNERLTMRGLLTCPIVRAQAYSRVAAKMGSFYKALQMVSLSAPRSTSTFSVALSVTIWTVHYR